LQFYRATYQHQRFFPITSSAVLMLNGEVGVAGGMGGQELPFYKNFYAGGVGSVRGYDTASLGPYETTNGEVLRLGGTRRVVFNAEVLVPLYGFGMDKSVRLGPFFDAGQVYSSDSNTTDGGGVRTSVGLAAAWSSPMGPLKFSLAQPLNDKSGDKLQRFQFQMGQTF
jgi:outer membrane protein insertion porin family